MRTIRHPRALALVLIPILLLCLVGCGGGGGAPANGGGDNGNGDNGDSTTVVNPNTTVIPDDGSVEITEGAPGTLTLTGAVPELEPGDIIVSAIGRGLLRKVEAVLTTGVSTQNGAGSIEVETSQATLEDLFETADIHIEKQLGPSDFESMEPLVDGVSFGAASSSVETSDLLYSIAVNFDRAVIAGTKKDPIVYIDGGGSFELEYVLDIRLDDWTTEYFKFGTTASATLNVEVVAKREYAVEKKKIKIGHLKGAPFAWAVPTVPPLPVVITPVMDVYVTFEGSLDAEMTFKPIITLSATCAIIYEKGAGWSGIAEATKNFDVTPTPELTVTANAKVGLFCPDVCFWLYGAVGPYVAATLPYGEMEYVLQSSPPRQTLDAWIGFDFTLGARIEVLGKTLVEDHEAKLLDGKYKVWHLQYDAGGNVPTIIQSAMVPSRRLAVH